MEGLYVKLKPGLNKLGYYIVGWKKESKYTSSANNGKFEDKFIDFKWLTVNYVPLTIIADPIQGQVTKEVKFTASTMGTAPKAAKYVWNFGDGTETVTKTNDSIATHTFEKAGNYNVKVELFDASNNTKITEAVKNMEIKDITISMSFNFNFTKKMVFVYNSDTDTTIYECDYQISGIVEVYGTNKVVSITQDASTKEITVLLAKKELYNVSFKCTFSNYVDSDFDKWFYPGSDYKFMVTFLGLKELKCRESYSSIPIPLDAAGNGKIGSYDGSNYCFIIQGEYLFYEEWWFREKISERDTGEKIGITPSFRVTITHN